MDWSLFFDVFDLLAVLYAVATGVLFGSTVLLYFSLKYPSKVLLSTKLAVSLTILSTAFLGTLFFAGQIVQAYATDPNWPRALGRAALWEVFSVALGLGFGVARSFAHRRSTIDE
jgi:hypothetical protein